MLQLESITKTYRTGDLIQKVLNQVTLNFRDNEFVSILGQSGSGKTTMLNIIGGLDRYDSGNLIINGVSTKLYKERDWDVYRNHTIGFVFQNYNLISHQTILSNVELALTISGISSRERTQRAKEALMKVGLGDQLHKRPSQLSGGQMQRVAIARALVNDPEILLADEPTGALDSSTSVQIMELLKAVAKEKLVIMVTHNPELAETYSSRIVTVKDGQIIGDTNPYQVENGFAEKMTQESQQQTSGKMKKASMSFLTALKLSFQNLRTKKGRTCLTAFAGSIGIIGIAIILALSNGVNGYVMSIQKDTMSSYPIVVEKDTMNLGQSFITKDDNGDKNSEAKEGEKSSESKKEGKIYSDSQNLEMANEFSSLTKENDLKSFKEYLEKDGTAFKEYTSKDGIVYSYNTPFVTYTKDSDGKIINTDGTGFVKKKGREATVGSEESRISISQSTAEELLSPVMSEVHPNFLSTGFEMVQGDFPQKMDEAIIILDEDGNIPLEVMYQLGMLPSKEYQALIDSVSKDKNFEAKEYEWECKDLIGKEYYVVPECDFYEENEGVYTRLDSNSKKAKELSAKGIILKITGVVKPVKHGSKTVSGWIGYTEALTEHLINYAKDSKVVKAQLADEKTDIFSGEELVASALQANYDAIGYTSKETPLNIGFYVDNFDDKEKIADAINEYNNKVDDAQKIVYTDLMQVMISSVTTIIDVISYILIAFVAISLIVSSLMIGIITYISVLERTREIGILRALGASKKNIKNVFNAETIIIGFASGLIGILLAEGIIGIINGIISLILKNATIHASLPILNIVALILLSMFLTFLGGCIPSRKAAKKDPVEALRSE